MKKKIFLVLIILFSCCLFFNLNNFVLAQSAAEQFNKGLKNTGDKAGYPETDPAKADATITNTVAKIISAVLMLVGVIFLLLMIYGGYKWMMARGNQEEVTKAKNIIIASIIGLIIVLAAYAITFFMMENVLFYVT